MLLSAMQAEYIEAIGNKTYNMNEAFEDMKKFKEKMNSNRYFNKIDYIIKHYKTQDGLMVITFVPNKMKDENGN